MANITVSTDIDTFLQSADNAAARDSLGVIDYPYTTDFKSGVEQTRNLTTLNSGSGFLFSSNVTSVYIGSNVTSIGYYSFGYCTALTSITIPDSVIGSIGSYAFYQCTSLTSVNIPDSVTSIGSKAFGYCTSLTSINIPDSVTSIGGYAFSNCTGLTSVTIPNSVTSIGERAFQNCTGLTSVTIPNSVTSIGNYAFCNTSLTSVTIPNSVTSIGDYAFAGCTSLTNVTIGNSVTSIGSDVFRDCSSLTSITIPDSVTSIGNYAFFNCAGLSNVTIGNSVTSIGQQAFAYCTNLASIFFESMAAPIIELDVFVGISSAALIQYPQGATGYAASYDGVPTQEEAAPFVTIDPISKSTVSGGESYDITITSNTDWTVVESLDWANMITSLPLNSGNGTVTVTVGANTTMGARSGTISIGGELHTLVQDGTDTDSDGLLDSYEQTIIDADLGDAIDSLDDVLPGDDFDGDGRTNLQEQNDGTDPIDADSYRTPPETTWYTGASYLSDGWRYFGWFKGFKPEGANWIYHGRHGWLYTLGADTSSLFLWDVALGRWMFTNETAYPWMYAYGPDGGWVFFFEGGRPGGRYFKRGDTGQTLSEQQLRMAP